MSVSGQFRPVVSGFDSHWRNLFFIQTWYLLFKSVYQQVYTGYLSWESDPFFVRKVHGSNPAARACRNCCGLVLKSLWTGFSDYFWTTFGPVRDYLWSTFGLEWTGFGYVLELLWTCFAVILDLFRTSGGVILAVFGLILKLFWTGFGLVVDLF